MIEYNKNRITYTNDAPASFAVFNSITDNAAIGDERNFVRVREIGSGKKYSDEVEVISGREYEVYIAFHNNAASNTNATGYGIAKNTRIASGYPVVVTPEKRGMISSLIYWDYIKQDNLNEMQSGVVWDEAYLVSKSGNVTIRYKEGTAIIHNGGKANGSVLPKELFTQEGTKIGFDKLDGNIPGCAEYSGYITYTIYAE